MGIDRINLLPAPNLITRASWENDAVNYEGEVDDELDSTENGGVATRPPSICEGDFFNGNRFLTGTDRTFANDWSNENE